MVPSEPTSNRPAFAIPAELEILVAGYGWHRVGIGESRAEVFRLAAPGRTKMFVKREAHSAASIVLAEAERLRWLAGVSGLCPPVLGCASDDQASVLVTAALPGRDLASDPGLAPAETVALAASALRDLHALPLANCPFDRRRPAMTAEARRHLLAGVVDAEDFDDERLGWTPAAVLRQVEDWPAFDEDLVVAHGDASLPNFLAADGRFTGFVDCGRLGVADRHLDLAICAASVVRNLGPDWVEPFFSAYGLARPNPGKLAFYRAVDDLM